MQAHCGKAQKWKPEAKSSVLVNMHEVNKYVADSLSG